jgi:hypothetical protein
MFVATPVLRNTILSLSTRPWAVEVTVSVAEDAPVTVAAFAIRLDVIAANRPLVCRAEPLVVGLTYWPFQNDQFTSSATVFSVCATCQSISDVIGFGPPPGWLNGADCGDANCPTAACLV